MHSQQTYQIMALAAVCQASEMVRLIARQASCDDIRLRNMLNSITVIDADSPMSIYGDFESLQLGYQVLLAQLGNSSKKDGEVTRYIMAALTLERSLTAKPQALSRLSAAIDQLKRQLTHFDLLDDNTIANIATIYTDVISPLGRRIQITGQPEILKQPHNQHKIRALLLAAIRAAVLWRQLGGKRRQLIFKRQQIIDIAQQSLTD